MKNKTNSSLFFAAFIIAVGFIAGLVEQAQTVRELIPFAILAFALVGVVIATTKPEKTK